VQFVTTGRSCCIISVLNIYVWKEETLCPEYGKVEGLCVGRTNEKFMPFLVCTVHLRKVGKL
jgi:hypothetical protein